MRLFEYVLEISRQGNFTKAAASLCIAQPSLSQQVGKLEKDLGVTLFYRGRGAVTPTPEGVRFLDQAEQIIRMRDDLEREMRERSEGVGQELTIGAPAITGGHVLPPLLEAYGQRFPQVRVKLVEESTEKLEDLAVRGLTDITILALPVDDHRLSSNIMLTEPLYLALPPTVRPWMPRTVASLVEAAQGEAGSGSTGYDWPVLDQVGQGRSGQAGPVWPDGQISLGELSQAPFILLKHGYGFRTTVLQLCADNGFAPTVTYETSSIETAQSLAAHGLGVTLVPQMVARTSKQRPLYVALTPQPTRTLVFAYRKDRYLSLAARSLLEVYDDSFRG